MGMGICDHLSDQTVDILPSLTTSSTMITLLLLISLHTVSSETGQCDLTSECGFGSVCMNQTCSCEEGFILHSNHKDCVNASCVSPDCVSCVQGTCQRCVHFIDKQTRECLHTCTGKAEIVYTGSLQGSVCTQKNNTSDLSDIIIGITAGVSAGILLCVIIGLCLHFYLKRRRGRVKLQGRYIHTNSMEMGQMRKIPVFENKGYVIHPEQPVIEKEAYLREVEKMKPSAQMLLDLLNQIRKRVRAMEPTDARIPTYKGVIHQLCRVLVMLNKKDMGSSVPADGLSLLEWARQMLQDYVETRQSLEDVDTEDEGRHRFPTSPTPETTSTSISSEHPTAVNTEYASPIDSLERGKNSAVPRTTAQISPSHQPGHYSSVPVPYIENHIQTNGTLRTVRTVPVSAPRIPSAENSGSSADSHGVRSGYKNYPNPRVVAVSHDPSGAPQNDTKSSPDIYAPASSYSDYAQPKISTFSGGVTRSLSSNSPSNSGYDSEDEPNPDGLPFDLEDATEPVEV